MPSPCQHHARAARAADAQNRRRRPRGRTLPRRRTASPPRESDDVAPLEIGRILTRRRRARRARADDAPGQRVSDDLYWPGRDEGSMQALNGLGVQSLRVSAHASGGNGETTIHVRLENPARTPALAAKLTWSIARAAHPAGLLFRQLRVTAAVGASRDRDPLSRHACERRANQGAGVECRPGQIAAESAH